MKKKHLVHCLFAGLVLAGASPALRAQENNAPAQNNPPPRRGQPFPGATRPQPPPSRFDSILTEEQLASLRAARQAQQDKVRELETKLRDAHKALFEAGLNAKFDETVVRQKAQAVANLEVEIAVLSAKAFSQIRPPLSPEQIEKFRGGPPLPAKAGQGEQGRRPEPPATNHITTNSPATK